jgi:predicted N-acyltransferase
MADPVLRIHGAPSEIDAKAWNDLLALQAAPSPFMRHEYLDALHLSGSATPESGWTPQFATLTRGKKLLAACPLYIKDHSYGEYVFDWAWANAYEQHGLSYYPKALVAVPFTPVPGSRLLAVDAYSRALLVHGLVQWCKQAELSSLHLLFGADEDIAACEDGGLMLRNTVQFHWTNQVPTLGSESPDTEVTAAGPQGYADFDAFLASLSHDKRKKIRQESPMPASRSVRHAAATSRRPTGTSSIAATPALTASMAMRRTCSATSFSAWPTRCPRPGCFSSPNAKAGRSPPA